MKNRLLRYLGNRDHEPLTVRYYASARKLRIYRSLTFLSISHSAIWAFYKGTMMLNDYEHDFLGLWSYGTFSLAGIFGFLVLPKFFLLRFGLQRILRAGTILCSLLIFILHVNMIGTVIPASLFLGLVSSTIRTSQHLYVYGLAKIMSKISGDDLEIVLLRFSGIFHCIHRAYEVACHLPISLVPLSDQISNASKEYCGPGFNFGDYGSLSEFTMPPRSENFRVASVAMLSLAFCALLLSIVLIESPNKLTSTNLGMEDYKPGFSRTCRLFGSRRLRVLIPMTFFSGFETMMMSYDFKTAYVGCTESPERSVLVYFLGCLASSQMSLALSLIVEATSFQFILGLAAGTHLVLLLILLLQSRTGLIGYYVLSTMWGLASSVWNCLLFVLYGMLSPGDELDAYSHLGFWYSFGAFGNLFTINLVPVSFRLWTALGSLLLAGVGILLLPSTTSCTSKRVAPVESEGPVEEADASRRVRMNDPKRRVTVYFSGRGGDRVYNSAEVKSIETRRIHHVTVTKTRSRFDRHDSSNEEF